MPPTLNNWTRSLSPTCRDAAWLQSRSLDVPLPLAHRIGLNVHLMLCRWCRRYGSQIRFLHGTLQADELKLVNKELQMPAQTRERLKEWLRRTAR